MKFFKKQKPPLGMPALPPTTKHTTLVIFLKLDVEFRFFFSVNYIRTKLDKKRKKEGKVERDHVPYFEIVNKKRRIVLMTVKVWII